LYFLGSTMPHFVVILANLLCYGAVVYVRMADEFVSDLSKLTARDLDKLAPNNPLMLSLTSSEGIVNTLMLEKPFAAAMRKEHFQVVKDANGWNISGNHNIGNGAPPLYSTVSPHFFALKICAAHVNIPVIGNTRTRGIDSRQGAKHAKFGEKR
jgi:hypothetical protein